ncbi:MAG: phosphate ABC transporter permease PstA [Halomonadaceae bacterium]|nr:MAG: phosphate ABC transporter permease PstA [Halomonadaceae bacterium]
MNLTQRDWLFTVTGGLLVCLVLLPLVAMLFDLLRLGLPVLGWEFLLTAPSNAGRSGGIAPLLISTGWILLVCLSVAVPVGLGCAVFLNEWLLPESRLSRGIGLSLDVLSGVPSIIFGLFGYQVFAITLGLGFSILSGGLALACMVLPFIVRTSQQSLAAVPAGYRQAAQALSLSQTGMLWRVVLPTASPGIAAGVVLATGRALGETAVLIFTAGYVLRQPDSVLDSGRALAVHIYDLATNVTGGTSHGAATALVLLALILIATTSVRSGAGLWSRYMLEEKR